MIEDEVCRLREVLSKKLSSCWRVAEIAYIYLFLADSNSHWNFTGALDEIKASFLAL